MRGSAPTASDPAGDDEPGRFTQRLLSSRTRQSEITRSGHLGHKSDYFGLLRHRRGRTEPRVTGISITQE
jgi:hypothetical protein